MFLRLFHFLNGPSPLHPNVVEGRLSPIQFRPFRPEDLDRCLEIYTLNEPGRFPTGVKDQYKQWLESNAGFFLVGEKNGQIICTGGVSRFKEDHMLVFCCGLVHPDYQGQGFGTALTLARLALLNPILPYHNIFIFAVEKSIGFYRRMGFRHFEEWKDPSGNMQPSGVLVFDSIEVKRCQKLLKAAGIIIPEGPIQFRDE